MVKEYEISEINVADHDKVQIIMRSVELQGVNSTDGFATYIAIGEYELMDDDALEAYLLPLVEGRIEKLASVAAKEEAKKTKSETLRKTAKGRKIKTK